ncbi:hypothetical protein [Catenuloplanes japonicus]|uniref:hypothetical protein n=1 Tax=Catenuloplanes japonicus TaxID=33876 RepID=UPI00052437D3|nr:hypothetical protein [Catenuloplanes japonicus]
MSGPPASYSPATPPYPPTSGAGYNNPYPVSGGGYPTSPPPQAYSPPPPPFTPPPQAYPPVYTPPPPQNKGRRGLNVLIGALVSVVLVLLCCIGGAVWFSSLPDSDTEAGSDPTPSASAWSDPNIDACTVGTWNISSHVEDLEVPGVGTIKLTGGKGAKLTLTDDGTAVMNYGAGTEWTGSVSGQNVRLRIKGPVTYDYTARNDRITLTGTDTSATFVIYVNGEETAAEQEFLAANDVADYTCTDTRLTQKGKLYTIEYTRG